MKKKYLGVTAVIISLISILIAVLIFAVISFDPSSLVSSPKVAAASLAGTESQHRNLLGEYVKIIETIFAQQEPPSAEYKELFNDATAIIETTAAVEIKTPTLAMIYRSGDTTYALIDQKLYRKGDLIPGGYRITSINEDSINASNSQSGEVLELALSGSVSDSGISGFNLNVDN